VPNMPRRWPRLVGVGAVHRAGEIVAVGSTSCRKVTGIALVNLPLGQRVGQGSAMLGLDPMGENPAGEFGCRLQPSPRLGKLSMCQRSEGPK
jgi:hypothetical protein